VVEEIGDNRRSKKRSELSEEIWVLCNSETQKEREREREREREIQLRILKS
jgi:hypothetical protein